MSGTRCARPTESAVAYVLTSLGMTPFSVVPGLLGLMIRYRETTRTA